MSVIEKIIGGISPGWAASREANRTAAEYHKLQKRNIEAMAAIPFDSGANGNRMTPGWPQSFSMTGVREINRWSLRKMRDRARELERENVLAQAILARTNENIIGEGIRCLPQTPDEKFNQDVTALWNEWAPKADFTGRYTFSQLQQIWRNCYDRDGEVGIIQVSRGDDAFLQTVSGDFVDSNTTVNSDGIGTVHGIDLSPDGRPLAYHIKTADDGEWSEQIVPARWFIFYARTLQPTDYRGVTIFSGIFDLLEQIDKFTEAEIIKKRIEACQGLIIKKKTALQSYGALTTDPNTGAQRQAQLNMQPGMIHYTEPDEDATAFNPSTSEVNYDQFVTALNRKLGIASGLSLELLTFDFRGVSGATARAGILQCQRKFKIEQQKFIDRVLRRIYQWRLSKWVKAGELTVPKSIEKTYWQHIWVPPGFALLDPNKEIQAEMAELDAGLTCWSDLALSRGHNFTDLLARRQRDEAALKKAGVLTSRSTLTRDTVAVDPEPVGPIPEISESELEDQGVDTE